jgi:hypothetical protein
MIAKTERDARRQAAILERRKAYIERWAQPRIRKAFVKMGDHFALLYEQGGELRMATFADEVEKIMEEALNDVYDRVSSDMLNYAKGSTKGAIQNIEKKEDATTEELERAYQLLLTSFAEEAITQSVFITSTLGQEIAQMIADDPELVSKGPREVARAIRAKTKDLSVYNSLRIARTEVNAASNEAQTKFTEELWDEVDDGPLYKRWHAARGSRTRDSHKDMDGKYVPNDSTFSVRRQKGGTDQMKYPGDRSASVGNLANCRCNIVFLAEELVPPSLRRSN